MSVNELLKPPSGPWKQELSPTGFVFVHNADPDLETGYLTRWEKSLLGTIQSITRVNESPDKTRKRVTGEKVQGAQRVSEYRLTMSADVSKSIHLTCANGEFAFFEVDTPLDVAKRPPFLNVARINASYASDGTLAVLRAFMDPPGFIDEHKLRAGSLEENLAGLVDLYTGAENSSILFPLAPNSAATEEPQQFKDSHRNETLSVCQDKSLGWTKEEKDSLNDDLEFVKEMMDEAAVNILPIEGVDNAIEYLGYEIYRSLPLSYPKLEGEAKTAAFDKAFHEAILTAYRCYDLSKREPYQSTVFLAENPEGLDQYTLALCQGHLVNDSDFSRCQILFRTFTDLPVSVDCDGTVFHFRKSKGNIVMQVGASQNPSDQIVYQAQARIPMRQTLKLIQTDHSSDWANALQANKTFFVVTSQNNRSRIGRK